LAGCGKTTTIALLCNQLQKRHANREILYLVFGRKNEEEAKQSNKFPKDRMEIRTTHAYILRYYFGEGNFTAVEPQLRVELKEIIDVCDLESQIIELFPDLKKRQHQRITNTVASYVRRTLEQFQSSAEPNVTKQHVFWRATSFDQTAKRNAWKKKILWQHYMKWAQMCFDAVQEQCQAVRNKNCWKRRPDISITHDAYLKVAQLEDFYIEKDIIMVDEAQDMTPCQASLFWGPTQRQGKLTYLFGDQYQQLYRFRGAGDSFEQMVQKSRVQLSLTGSFRFGAKIAKFASSILQDIDGKSITGLSTCKGKVTKEEVRMNTTSLVVLCRSNQGIFDYLIEHRPQRWCTLGGRITLKAQPWVYDLEAFLQEFLDDNTRDESTSFEYKDEVFQDIASIQEFADDEGDSDLLRYLYLLLSLVKDQQSFNKFLKYVNNSYQALSRDESYDEYKGVILGTVHKSKGLEFQRVLIYNDYKWAIILSTKGTNPKIFSDEANILYVAVTRAKKELYLASEAEAYFKSRLGKNLTLKDFLSSAPPLDKNVIEVLSQKWKKFKASESAIESISDIPWPLPCENAEEFSIFELQSGVDEESYRLLIKRLLLWYHPDKLGLISSRITSPELLREVQVHFGNISQRCNELNQLELGWNGEQG